MSAAIVGSQLTLTSCEDIRDLTTKILFHEPQILDEVESICLPEKYAGRPTYEYHTDIVGIF